MSTLEFWKRNIKLRIVMLKHGSKHFSEQRMHKAAGWSLQRHHQVLKANSLSTATMSRLANVLACPVSVLLDGDPRRVVTEQIPATDWLLDMELVQ